MRSEEAVRTRSVNRRLMNPDKSLPAIPSDIALRMVWRVFRMTPTLVSPADAALTRDFSWAVSVTDSRSGWAASKVGPS
ncbi:MAG: hypothetical protein CMJ67_10420 [Planctomycetaceae bacterium]|nr:hypothetical protein [Planctomycetaceae bacterium]